MQTRSVLLMCAALASHTDLHAADSAAESTWAAPNWSEGEARLLSKSARVAGLEVELKSIALDAPKNLLAELELLSNRNDFTWPEREAALQRVLAWLHTQTVDRIPADALAYLAQWQPRTLIAHEEHPEFGTPMFAIAAQAQGLQNRWRRAATKQSAQQLLSAGIDPFIAGWLAVAGAAERAGYLDALAAADVKQQRALLQATAPQLKSNPALTAVIAQAAITLADVDALSALIEHGDGAQLHPVLAVAASELSTARMRGVLQKLIAVAAPERVALTIAQWSPRLASDAETEAMLFDLLGDPQLGSSAALALSASASASMRKRLQTLAEQPENTLRTTRARMALRPQTTALQEITP